ncbi:trk system potassium uptake protein TrkA [Salsuginibacillus halophilus]|uniref:Trk system potassium uptake protein TrkA n=1 Tax=Salsuginibacillus halophilus TaxID=517424 RepID=A0A2P8HXA5_9BACI|nr:TrkA family potassium uptake protein [Salsuginibacillus halophilus]PSL50859.1 trk system potassium uptake protein TrkA [Salsuginibacillus halophilus]
MKKQFAVIGLGRFGGSICKSLVAEGMEVLAIDMDEEKVNEFAPDVTQAAIADTTDEKALKSLGIRNFDHVIVAIGDNIQASILTTLMLEEMGVEHITVKAQNDYHEKVLERIGADEIVHPERDIGVRIAHNVVSENVLDHLELSDEYSISELVAGSTIAGETIYDLDFREKYGSSILAIKRGDDMIVSPLPDETIQQNDVIIVLGANQDINRLENHWMD